MKKLEEITKNQYLEQVKFFLKKVSILKQQNLNEKEIGAPSINYISFVGNELEYIIGFLLDKTKGEKLEETKDFKKVICPKGSYVHYVHKGPYEKIHDIWKVLRQQIDQKGLISGQCCFEKYLNDPHETRKEDLVTEIFNQVSKKKRKVEEVKKGPIAMGGTCHFELGFIEASRVKKFYSELLDWDFYQEFDDYLVFKTPNGDDGGFKRVNEVKNGTQLMYFVVNEINDSLKKKIIDLGGKINQDLVVLPNTGSFLEIVDCEGNSIGVWYYEKKK